MSRTLESAGICPHCGSALGAAAVDPALAFQPELVRYDLAALAQEAAKEEAYDESARIRVTQQDIRKLLEKRRHDHK